MEIKKEDLLLLKINTPSDIDFLEEHKKIIDSKGYVWLCKFGKTNLILSKIKRGKIIFLKDTKKNNDNVYVVEYTDVIDSDPSEGYPNYYNDVDITKSLWFKVVKIYKYDYEELLDNFITASSFSSLDGVFRSMCNSFYIRPTHHLFIEEDY